MSLIYLILFYTNILYTCKKGDFDIKSVLLYSDGSARGNPGKGGYGTVVKYLNEKSEVERTEEFTKGFELTTNNRMELLGVIAGLESLTIPCSVKVVSDSAYVVNAFTEGWIDNWIKNGWKTSTKKNAKNSDLWKRLLSAKKHHIVEFEWVKGHNGHPENERCDWLATASADGKNLITGDDGLYREESPSDNP